MNKSNDTMGSITKLTSSFSIPVNLSVSKEDIKKIEDLIKQAQSIFDEINDILGDNSVKAQIMNDKE